MLTRAGVPALIAVVLAITNAAGTAHAAVVVPSACTLLTPADVQAAFGGTSDAGDLTTAPDGHESICQWIVSAAKGGGFGVQLDVKRGFGKKVFAEQRRIASAPTKLVKHLGDGAFSERAKIGSQVFDDLWVRRGPIGFRVEALRDLGPKPLIAASRIVLARLAAGSPH